MALLVPKAFAQEFGAAEGQRADLSVENGALVVKVLRPGKRRKYALDELLAGITDENRHTDVDLGAPCVDETW